MACRPERDPSHAPPGGVRHHAAGGGNRCCHPGAQPSRCLGAVTEARRVVLVDRFIDPSFSLARLSVALLPGSSHRPLCGAPAGRQRPFLNPPADAAPPRHAARADDPSLPHVSCRRRPTGPRPMLIRVLGCSGAIAAGCKTTSFLLDDDVLIDAGTGVCDLSLDEMVRIDHILISHSHLDHILSIALLADTTLRRRRAEGRGPIRIHALAPTLAALRAHIFNGVVWPDFTRLPSAEHPALELEPIVHGQRLDLGGRTVEVLVADHTVPACGFAVASGDGLVGLHRRHRAQPGAVAPARRDEGGAPGHRDGVRRRRARAGTRQPPPVPVGARRGAGAARRAAERPRRRAHHAHQARRRRPGDGADRRPVDAAPGAGAGRRPALGAARRAGRGAGDGPGAGPTQSRHLPDSVASRRPPM